jgi:hypothetical protein
MNPHNRKPLYYRSANPNLPQVGEIASKLFQWDETSDTPVEVSAGEAFMPPMDIVGDYILWGDSYTLGYSNEADAGPIFFSDNGAGDVKILQIINTASYRLNGTVFNDVASAKAWALTEPRIYVEDDSANAPLVCDPSVTNAYSGGSGPSGLNLNQVNRAVITFNSSISGASFINEDLTKTKVCTAEYLQDRYDGYADGTYTTSIGSTSWGDWSNNTAIYYTNTNWNGIPAVGDVIYRDQYGDDYFGAGGFIFQDTAYQMNTDSRAFNWITVGANGVVTNVENLGYMTGN